MAAALAAAALAPGDHHGLVSTEPTRRDVALDVRDVSLRTVIGEVDGAPVTLAQLAQLDRRSRDAIVSLWRAIHAAKRDALAALEDEALLRITPPAPPAPAPDSEPAVREWLGGARPPAAAGLGDALARHALTVAAARDARRAQLAAARRAVAIEEHVPAVAADRETRWPAVVARLARRGPDATGAGGSPAGLVIGDEAIEAAARLRLYRLRGRVRAEIARAFEAHADARRVAREARRQGVTAEALLASARGTAPEVGESDVDAFLATYRGGAPPRPRVRDALAGRRRAQAELALRDRLRATIAARLLVAPNVPPRLDASGARSGPEGPPVVLLAYTNLRCTLCAETERALAALEQGGLSRRVRIERRPHFPEAALPLLEDAIAARCAAAQGRDGALRDGILTALASGGGADGAAVAAAVAPDREALARCLGDPGVRAQVLAQREEAERLGLDATPSFLVNGLPLVGFQGRERLETTIAAELAARADGDPPDTAGGRP
jgi:protein-disulfide isomerase